LLAGVAAGKVRATGAADQQRVSSEHPPIDTEADSIRSMSGRVQHFEPQIAHFEHIAVGHVNSYVRSGRMTLHHNFRIRQIGEVEGAATMVRVGMGVDQVIEPKAVVDATAI